MQRGIVTKPCGRPHTRIDAFSCALFDCAACVRNATITGVTNGSTVRADTAISCTADDNAHPPANYRWTINFQSTEGPQFLLEAGTQYTLICNASNNFNRRGCYATDYVEFNCTLQLHSLRSMQFMKQRINPWASSPLTGGSRMLPGKSRRGS